MRACVLVAAIFLSACAAMSSIVSPSGSDYRDVEARGCGRRLRYTYVKVGPVESWPQTGVSTAM